jgi:60 kDa SS-A/Ro ribonucleoprotein
MSDYLLDHGTRETPQSEPIRDDQAENSAGGFVWAVDDWTRLRRFLILGSEGGSYYASERDLTKQNVGVVRRLATKDGLRLVAEAVEVSEAGRAPSNDPALYALAAAISLGDREAKRAAAEALPRVARIGTHLFHFVAYAETMRGWGKTLRWAVANWYASKDADRLAYDVVKYRQRDGWSHRDLLRLAHPKTSTPATAALFGWITHQRELPRDYDGESGLDVTPAYGRLIDGFESAQSSPTPKRTAELVREYGLPREALLTDHLTDPDVWRALLDAGMGTTALVRNLANMTRIGVLEGDYRAKVLDRLADADEVAKSRIHPLQVLMALATYAAGRGLRGGNEWTPIPQVTDALDRAFYLAFGNVEPTGKRILLALDVSGSMASGLVAGSPLTPRAASVAMALVTLAVEPNADVVGFTGGMVPLGISSRQRLDDAVRTVSNLPFDRTDCAQPMLYALREKRTYDAYVIYTDSETWAGAVHPTQALQRCREVTAADARLAVVGMVSNGFTIADPTDRGMLDVVGFDTSTPGLISEFVSGRV